MVALNLPPFPFQLKKDDNRVWIFDTLRKKFVVLTPEEWVRQHFLQYLVGPLQYPKSLIRVEGGLSYNQLAKRSDIVVFSRDGKPWMVIECKSPDQRINENTLRQASVYNRTLMAKYLVVTNGLAHHYFRIDWAAGSTHALASMPAYE